MNLNTRFFTFLACISSFFIFAQKEGYWDKERATKREVVVNARNRIVIKTDDLPTGTTEIVYRITMLDDNQQLATSLVSVLKSIPDPTGISQGSAGAIFLMSKISGDDKCKYAVFSNEVLANDYKLSGQTTKACFNQKEAITKDAKRLSIGKSSCLTFNQPALWFGFESKNWVMKQKIILEVVPWVDIKLSRGWATENRKYIINQCKSSQLANKIQNPNDFCVCILDKIQNKYTFQEFTRLLIEEQSKSYKDYGDLCFVETGASKTVNSEIRSQVLDFMNKGDYGNAISKSLLLVDAGNATAQDYQTIGRAYILTKQYEKAIKHLKMGENIDPSELLVKLDLAHAFLLNKEFRMAKNIYKKYQGQNVTDTLNWVDKIKLDFDVFKKAGLSTEGFEKVLKLVKN